MALLEDLQLDHVPDAGEIEKQMAAGFIPPEGYHHAQLVGTREGEANSGTKFHELTFQILAGPAKGMKVKESLFGPSGKATDSDEKARNRMRLFAHRLGVIKKEPIPGTDKSRYVPIDGVSSFMDVIDKAHCIIDVRHEEREYEKDGKMRKINEAKLTFEGVLPVDDKRVAEKKTPIGKVVAGASGAGGGKPGTNGTGSLPKKDDYSDL